MPPYLYLEKPFEEKKLIFFVFHQLRFKALSKFFYAYQFDVFFYLFIILLYLDMFL